MTRLVRAGAVLALLLSVLTVREVGASPSGCNTRAHVAGGDWPMMGGNLGQTNYQTAEHVISRANAGSLKLRWTSAAPVNPGQGTPVVAGNCVFVTGLGVVYALDAASGKLVWRSGPGPVPFGGDGFVTYPPQGVSVFDGRVHMGVDNNNKPVSMAFDARTGERLWTSKPLTFGYKATQLSVPKVLDGIQLFFTTGPDFDPHGRPGFALLDEKSGRVLSKRTTLTPQMLAQGYAGGGVWATAAIDPVGKYAYVGTSNPYTKTKESPYDNAMIKIDLNRRRSSFGQIVAAAKGTPDAPTNAVYNQPECQTLGPAMPVGLVAVSLVCGQDDADFGIGPTVFRNRHGRLMLAGMQKNGHLHILDATTMAQEYDLLLGPNAYTSVFAGNLSMPAWDGRYLYVAGVPGTLYAIDPDDGSIVWAAPGQDGPAPGRPVVGGNGVVWTINGANMVVAHDTSTGLPIGLPLRPSQDTGQTCSPGANGGMAFAHHTLFINCGGYLAAYGL
ncbi:MAG: PQQ-binding-like beta-propeller repeat protein [Mycobacteriales bacterium]